jgi:hypothetical protein
MTFPGKPVFVRLAFAFVFLLVICMSCKKSNSSNTTNQQISATINGTAWVNTLPIQSFYDTAFEDMFNINGISVKSGDSTEVSMFFYPPFPLNTPISSDTTSLEINYTELNTSQVYTGGGPAGHSLLTVSTCDTVNHKISGTFSGILYNITGGSDSLIVTNGAFNSSYTISR